jgi:hypothetical protein
MEPLILETLFRPLQNSRTGRSEARVLHLAAMPRLKDEGGTPHAPEICLKERKIKPIGNRASSKELLGFKSQAFDGQNRTLAQTETGRIDPVSIPKESGLGRSLRDFVPIKDFSRYCPSPIDGGNRKKRCRYTDICSRSCGRRL